MEWKDMVIDGYERIPGILDRALKDLTEKDLNWKPSSDTNSIGWLVWHLTRQQDAQMSDLMGEEQLWTKDEWYSKFGRQGEPEDVGFGHTPEQVAAFKSPDARTLLDYNREVVQRSKNYINGLSEDELGRELNEPRFQPLPTVGVRIISILNDSIQHAGQAAYVRGLLQGRGWQGY